MKKEGSIMIGDVVIAAFCIFFLAFFYYVELRKTRKKDFETTSKTVVEENLVSKCGVFGKRGCKKDTYGVLFIDQSRNDESITLRNCKGCRWGKNLCCVNCVKRIKDI